MPKVFDPATMALTDAPTPLDPRVADAVAKELAALFRLLGIGSEIPPEALSEPEGKAALEAVRDMLADASAHDLVPEGVEIDPEVVTMETAGALRMIARSKPLIRYLREEASEEQGAAPKREAAPEPQKGMSDTDIEGLLMARMGG